MTIQMVRTDGVEPPWLSQQLYRLSPNRTGLGAHEGKESGGFEPLRFRRTTVFETVSRPFRGALRIERTRSRARQKRELDQYRDEIRNITRAP